jgi:uncharacterized membrane protein YdbT with pleckstrin-like domain
MLNKLTQLAEEDLMPDEQVLFTAFSSWYAELKPILFAVISILASITLLIYSLITQAGPVPYVFGGLLFLLAPLLLINSILSHYSVRYFITTFRVIKRVGLFSKHLNYVPYSKIQNIKMRKNLSERIIDEGDVLIDVAGSSGIEVRIDNIRDPEKIHQLILENMRKKEKAGDGL